MNRISLLILASIFSLPALSQQFTDDDDFFEETPLVLTASRMSKPKEESPASITVIDRSMIEKSGMRDIADLFRMVPGFIVGYFKGHQPIVTYHGMGWAWVRGLQAVS